MKIIKTIISFLLSFYFNMIGNIIVIGSTPIHAQQQSSSSSSSSSVLQRGLLLLQDTIFDYIIPDDLLKLFDSFSFYTDLHDEPNIPWKKLKRTLTIGTDTFGPAYGSTIRINKDNLFQQIQTQQQQVRKNHKKRNDENNDENYIIVQTDEEDYFNRELDYNNIRIHTLTNSFIPRTMFNTMTRWYMEDGNTQIFRMFPNEDNIRNDREDAPRVEAFHLTNWKYGDGWYEFSAIYTFMKLRDGAVFQLKHNHTYWSMQLLVEENQHNDNFDLYYNKLNEPNAKTLLVENILYTSYTVRVLDDGLHHQIYINNELLVFNQMSDRDGSTKNEIAKNSARWGFYSPGSPIDRDILLFVTGAYVGKLLT